MIKWLKSLFKSDEEKTVTVEAEQDANVLEPVVVKPVKKTTKKKTKQVDLSAMTKNELLTYADEQGAVVAKSWTKTKIIEAIKKGK